MTFSTAQVLAACHPPTASGAAAGARCGRPQRARFAASTARPQHSRQASRATVSAAAAVPEVAAAELEPAAQEQWAACADLVQQRCGLDAEAADACLLKAFGWKGQGFWRQERVKQVPDEGQVAAALDFLASLGIGDGEVGPVVATFPEALGLRVEVMQENVEVLRSKWHLKGRVLTNAIKRKPRVLGNCIDCQGNCAGLCTRCWAQF